MIEVLLLASPLLYFLAESRGLQDLSSPYRTLNLGLESKNAESSPLDCQEIPSIPFYR